VSHFRPEAQVEDRAEQLSRAEATATYYTGICLTERIGIAYSLTGCHMNRYNSIFQFLIGAVFMAGSLAAVPHALGLEEFLVSLNTDVNKPLPEPKAHQDTPDRPDNTPAHRQTWQSMRNKRFPELTSRHIIIIARDEQGEEINPSLLLDPRLIKAEIFSPESGQIADTDQNHDKDADFIVDFPDDAGIDKIQFYHPRWTGTVFTLELIGETQVQ
jgi:hypothetical protein